MLSEDIFHIFTQENKYYFIYFSLLVSFAKYCILYGKLYVIMYFCVMYSICSVYDMFILHIKIVCMLNTYLKILVYTFSFPSPSRSVSHSLMLSFFYLNFIVPLISNSLKPFLWGVLTH